MDLKPSTAPNALKRLKSRLPIICICGVERPIARPFVNEKYFGFETEVCASCGAPPAHIYTYRDAKEMKKMANMLQEMFDGMTR